MRRISRNSSVQASVWISLFLLASCSETSHDITGDSGSLRVTRTGGAAADYGRVVAVDVQGDIVWAGHSNSPSLFSGASRGDDKTLSGGDDFDIVIAKQSPGGEIQASLRLGGDGFDKPVAIQGVDKQRFLLSGTTTSSDFPQAHTQNRRQRADVFIALISSDLRRVEKIRTLGGDRHDTLAAMARDRQGNVYLAGSTASSNFLDNAAGFNKRSPGQASGPYDIGLDAYIVKLSADLETPLAATVFGGLGDDYIYDIAIDRDGGVYVVGNTNAADFPTTRSAYDTSHNGSVDIFVSRFDSELATLEASTYLGWAHYDYGRAIVIDETGHTEVLVAGHTYYAPQDSKQQLPEAIQQHPLGGLTDLVLFRLDRSLATVVSATFLGGINDEYVTDIDLLHERKLLVTGYTASPDFGVLASGAPAREVVGYDMFVATLTATLDKISEIWTYGGGGNDFAYALGGSSAARQIIVGNSDSADLPHASGSGRLMDALVITRVSGQSGL